MAFIALHHLPGVLVEFLLGAVAWLVSAPKVRALPGPAPRGGARKLGTARHFLESTRPLSPWLRCFMAAAGLAGWTALALWFGRVGDAGVDASPARGLVGALAAVCFALMVAASVRTMAPPAGPPSGTPGGWSAGWPPQPRPAGRAAHAGAVVRAAELRGVPLPHGRAAPGRNLGAGMGLELCRGAGSGRGADAGHGCGGLPGLGKPLAPAGAALGGAVGDLTRRKCAEAVAELGQPAASLRSEHVGVTGLEAQRQVVAVPAVHPHLATHDGLQPGCGFRLHPPAAQIGRRPL